MHSKQIVTFCPAGQKDWREWLKNNHGSKQSVWLIYYKKKHARSTLTWSGAVDEALCFGWIDSTARPIDGETYMQFFCKRKPNSVWSKINKAKVQRLTAEELIQPAGYKSIETAKLNGSWTILDDVEELVIPVDLANAFKKKPGSKKHFESLSRSVRKNILQGLVLAKRPETRQKRINDIVSLVSKN